MKQIDLSIIIVNYNGGTFLSECIQSIRENTGEKIHYEIIIADNNSTDESIDLIEPSSEDDSKIKILLNKENVGFSKANNKGAKEATGRYLLFLNPDTVVYKDTMETLVSFMDEHKDAGAVTSKLVLPNGKLDDGSHRGFPTPWNAFCYFSGLAKVFPHSMFFNGYNMAWCELEKIHTVDAIVGAFMLVRREAGEEISWWDEDYFFYGEDLEFCFRLKEKGWKIYYNPTVSTLHYKGVSGGIKKESKEHTTADTETKIRATNARFEAMKIFYKKHYVKKYPAFLTWLVMYGIDWKLKEAHKKI